MLCTCPVKWNEDSLLPILLVVTLHTPQAKKNPNPKPTNQTTPQKKRKTATIQWTEAEGGKYIKVDTVFAIAAWKNVVLQK